LRLKLKLCTDSTNRQKGPFAILRNSGEKILAPDPYYGPNLIPLILVIPLVTNILLLLQWRTLIMLLPETLSILSKNPIFIALYTVVTTYFILAQSLDLNIRNTLSL